MFDHPFIHSPEDYESHVAACEEFAEATDQLPEPPAEIWIDDNDLTGEGNEDDWLDAAYEDRYAIDEYGMDGCYGDF
jgi:hypothetical protein